MSAEITPLPAGTRLLHIGPHKTGTTTMQAAFHQSRAALAEQGVHYAGKRAHSMAAAMASLNKALPTLSSAPTARWDELVAEVHASPADRVVLSSEFYSDAPPERVKAIIDDLGRDKVHVVLTLRAIHRIMPSQWQQYMQNRFVISYLDWLQEMLLNTEHTTVTPTFWNRHRHDRLIRLWADEVGADRVTVIVIDEQDKTMLASAFEQLLSLRPGTLGSAETANRSLTFTEVELLREFNRRWHEHGWTDADYTRLVRFGAARHLQQRTPDPDEQRLLTPRWAVDRALEVQREMAVAISEMGVRVIGDLDALADPALARDVGVNDPVTRVPADVAARLAAGLVKSVTDIPRRRPDEGRVVGELEAAARARPPGGKAPTPTPTAAPTTATRSLRARLGARVRRGR